ncbi:MAG TPA: MFS transporter [Alphaproteobacteria bacterium]|nr:MFS transporter [Alphaproteobacteria bacterium]
MLSEFLSGGIVRALRYPQYRNFALGDVVSLIGTWIQRVAIGWLTWELTHSGAWLGIVAFAELGPSILFSPIGGAHADRFDRRIMAMSTEMLLMLQSLAFVLLVFTDWISIWWILALTILRGSANSWSHPARQSLIASLVPRDALPTAVAMNAVLFNLARFIGPAVAGVIIVEWGIGYAFLCNTASFILFICVLYSLNPSYSDQGERKRQPLMTQMIEGYAYVIRHPGIGPIMLMLLLTAVFGRPIAELLPGFAGAVFDNGAKGLAWMTSTMGVGAMIGGAFIAQRGQVQGLTRIVMAMTCVMGLSLLVFSVVPWFPAALLAIAVVALATVTMSISCQSLIQTQVDGAMRGRVISVYGMIFRMGPALGALVMGGLVDQLGWRWPIAAGALICLGTWWWGQRRAEQIRAVMEKPAGV